MDESRSFEKPLRSLWALLTIAGAFACGIAGDDAPLGSETHFLARCTAECGGGLECIEGVCTRACAGDSDCTSLSASATCSAGGNGSGAAHCGVPCSGDGDCRADSPDWACDTSSCSGSPAVLATTRPLEAGRCPTFAGGVQQPAEVETAFERVPGSTDVAWAHADGSGVYWIDLDGGIFGLKKGDGSATILRPAPSTPGTRLGLMGDANRLYWTEASAYPAGPLEPGPPPPPGRVMTVSKDGGPVEVLAEAASLVLTPLGVDPTGRVFVTSSDGYANEVTASGSLERVANIPRDEGGGLQMVDGQVHWIEYEPQNELETISVLFTAIPGTSAPVRLQPIEGSFLAGRGVVFWAPEEYRSEELLLVQHYMMLNENTGCVQPLPNVENSIGQSLVDSRHIYWQSFNAVGSSSPGQPDAPAPILRVDLRTGRFERLTIPGLDVTVVSDLAAQDDSTIYVRQSPGEALFAVRKP
jgi:hypothetical protein